MRDSLALLVVAALLGCGVRAEAPAPPSGYVFAWPFIGAASLTPRGGTTRGAPVTLASEPSEEWRALQAAGASELERDRAAILAMAGDFRVSFDFLETIVFEPPHVPARPYRSWATERVYVVEDGGDFISLQHVLVLFTIDDDGERQGPFVQKHWRQDWQYEPRRVLEYRGRRRWELERVPERVRRGRWSQTVYHVDDTPRYASVGRWQHTPSFSAWAGRTTGRPLPRRELSVRHDYDLLVARNRHTILPNGWVHEQENLKTVLGTTPETPPITKAREIGVDRYERIRDFDFSAADRYWHATMPLWSIVRAAWERRLATPGPIRIASTCDGTPVFVSLFTWAQRFQGDERPSRRDTRAFVDELLDCIIETAPAR